MANNKRPLFQLRKELVDLTPSNDLSVSVNKDIEDTFVTVIDDEEVNNKNGLESGKIGVTNEFLTENDKIIVKSLNADPLNVINNTNLNNDSTNLDADMDIDINNINNNIINGNIDALSGKAIVNDNKNLFIWSFNSLQKTIPYNKIPINNFNNSLENRDDSSLNETPDCLLTWPVTMELNTKKIDTANNNNSNEFGLCLIYKKLGKIIFYENVSTINNLYSKLSLNMAHILDLKFSGTNEFITKTICAEPSGIVVATSTGRVLYITLRDSLGNPNIQLKQQLIGPKKNIFTKLFNFTNRDNQNSNNNHNNNQNSIVSLKNGPIVGKGERLLYIMTKDGDFQVWQLSIATYCYQKINVNVMNQILQSLNDLYPFAYSSLKILDANPVLQNDSNIHMILSSINDSVKTYYILSILIFDENSNNFTIFSTYRLNTYMEDSLNNTNLTLPKIIIPNSLNELDNTDKTENNEKIISIFIVFNDAVVLTQISSKFDMNFTLTRKFEDIISFKDNIDIIGLGYNKNQLYLMSKRLNNILQISLKDTLINYENIRFVKSHVDQAIFFNNNNDNNANEYLEKNNFIEFNLSKDIVLDNQTIEDDLKLCSDEIFYSKSKYLPNVSNLPLKNLNIRIKYYNNLLTFVMDNFNNKISDYLKLELIEKFEIMQCCYNFLEFLNENDKLPIVEVWQNIITKYQLTTEQLIVKNLNKFPEILTNFLTDLSFGSSESLDLKFKIISLIHNCIYENVLELGERKLRYDIFHLNILTLNKDKLPWFINLDNLTVWNKMFFQYKFSLNKKLEKEDTSFIVNDDIKEQFLTLLKILYYCFNQVSIYATNEKLLTVKDTTEYDELISINKLYLDNHLAWNQVLCEFNYQEQSIQITDFYKDLESLVETLETLPQDDPSTFEIYNQFFHKFEYLFASTLFEYYADKRNLEDLLFKFPQQRSYLIKFLQENIDKYGDIAWIQDILDNNYSEAATILVSLNLFNNDLSTNKLHLNIAKLSCLAQDDQNAINLNQLRFIQHHLDLLDYELEMAALSQRSDVKLNYRFVSTQLETQFSKILNDSLKNNKMIPLVKFIEFYTLIDDPTGSMLQQALDLIDQVGDSLLSIDVKLYLLTSIWRRVLLNGKFKETFNHYLQGKLYLKNNTLPTLSYLTDENYVPEPVLKELYGIDQWSNVNKFVHSEMKQLQDKYTSDEINSMISEINESQLTPQIIDYETNEITVNM